MQMRVSAKEREAWLRLSHCKGIGPARFQKILQRYPNLSNLFNQQKPTSVLIRCLEQWGLTACWDQAKVKKDLLWSEQPDCHILTLADPHYPALLKEIPSPPPILYVRGDVKVLSSTQIGMVGSRHPSYGGQRNALEMAHALSQAGLTITSGLALGIDACAHQGALKAKGKTIGVLGQGLQSIYPARHKALAHNLIEQGGALVSEYPIGTLPVAQNFPKRNRIISGLSLGVLVVEATLKSGSLITARYAVDQGRDVYAMPGSIHNPLAKGCHHLIRQGAKCIESVDHILEEFQPMIVDKSDQKSDTQALTHLDKENPSSQNNTILSAIGLEGTPIDTIIEQTGYPASQVCTALVALELEGKVCGGPSGYVRTQ